MVDVMAAAGDVICEDDVWQWLADVPDPEIPVVSVVDLGIVRGVETDGEAVIVTITPTYSGCPACLLYTSPSPRDRTRARMPSSA